MHKNNHMFPIHDDAGRLHGRPFVNYSLIAINAAVFTWEVLVTGNFTNRRATSEIYLEYGAIPKLVLAGDIPAVLTSMFMHGGNIAHCWKHGFFVCIWRQHRR